MKRYVLGVDGGGTKTHCALFDTAGDKVDFLEWGTTNHESFKGGYEDFKIEFRSLLEKILNRNGLGIADIKRCVFGLAGVDTKKQHEKISCIINELGIVDFILCNDSFLGIKAGCRNGYGICAINGTGFSVTGIDRMGKMLQIGGQGSYTGDKGGGVYLAQNVVSSVYNHMFKGAQKTLLVEMLLNECNVTSKYSLMDLLTDKWENNGKEFTRKMAIALYTAANRKDMVALRILEEVAEEYARCIGVIIDELDFKGMKNIEIVLAGSQFVKGENQYTRQRLTETLKKEKADFELSIKLLDYPCVAGAVIWALEGEIEKNCLYSKVVKVFC